MTLANHHILELATEVVKVPVAILRVSYALVLVQLSMLEYHPRLNRSRAFCGSNSSSRRWRSLGRS